jgi:hypothetical protein
MLEIAAGLAGICERWQSQGWDIRMAICAEEIDLSTYGIEHNCCIDGHLMQRIFAGDEEFMHYLPGAHPER